MSWVTRTLHPSGPAPALSVNFTTHCDPQLKKSGLDWSFAFTCLILQRSIHGGGFCSEIWATQEWFRHSKGGANVATFLSLHSKSMTGWKKNQGHTNKKRKKTSGKPLEDVKVNRLCWKLKSQQKQNTYFAQHVILQRASGRNTIPWCPVFSLVKKRRGSFARTHFSKCAWGSLPRQR